MGLFRRRKTDNKPQPVDLTVEVARLVQPSIFAPGAGIRVYNPSQLVSRRGLYIFDEMLKDDVVSNAVDFVKHAALSTGWTIKTDEETTEQIDTLLAALDNIDGTFLEALYGILSALEYGFSVTEVLYAKDEETGALRLKGFRTVPPTSIKFDLDKHGNIYRILQAESDYGPATIELPPEKFILFQYQAKFGNPYGRSLLEPAYRQWLIKDNAYKWLAMALERRGVPSIFALYDPSIYHGTALTALRQVIENIQASTAGTIPRVKDSLELWEPSIAGESGALFSQAIELCDRAIARALLMPALIGFADNEGGSLARARVHFDSFLIVIEHLRARLADVLTEQLIRRLVALLLPETETTFWFEFLPFSDEKRAELFRLWGELVQAGVVRPTVDDERYLRESLGMPELPEGVQSPATPTPRSQPNEETTPPVKHSATTGRIVNFKAIERDLDDIEAEAAERMREAIRGIRDALLTWIGDDVTAADIDKLQLRGMGAFQDAVMEFLRAAYRAGSDTARDELGKPQKMAAKGAFVPSSALSWLAAKKFYITGVFKDAVLREVRAILLNALKSGELVADTKEKIRGVFEQWIGSGTVLTTEARLETIIRTNATEAYNYGRLSEIRDDPDAVEAVEFSAILDQRTTEQCQLLHGKLFRVDDPDLALLTPPLHFNCRSVIVPVPAGTKVDKADFVTPSLIGQVKELVPPGFGGGR